MVLGMGGSAPGFEAAIHRLEVVADRLERGVSGGSAAAAPMAVAAPPSSSSPLADWDARVSPAVAALMEAASGMDKEVCVCVHERERGRERAHGGG